MPLLGRMHAPLPRDSVELPCSRCSGVGISAAPGLESFRNESDVDFCLAISSGRVVILGLGGGVAQADRMSFDGG